MMRQQLQQQPNGSAVPTTAAASTPPPAEVTAATATAPAEDASASGGLRNRAGESNSPYVRRHAETPVAWQLLDEATLSRAIEENKPIFMHIGFLADHRELPPPNPTYLGDPPGS